MLFVADEVVTGYGRIGGAWFASTRFGLEPDMITTAKGLTSGYLPMGAVFVAPRVAEPFFQRDAGVWWRHGYTYSGHAAAAAVALANLDIIEREGLLDEAARLEQRWRERWRRSPGTTASTRSAAAQERWRRSSSADPAAAMAAGQEAALARGRDPGGRRRRHPGLAGVRDDRRAGR